MFRHFSFESEDRAAPVKSLIGVGLIEALGIDDDSDYVSVKKEESGSGLITSNG